MSCFSKILENDKEYQGLTKAISAHGNPVGAIGLPEINKVLTVHCVCESLNKKAFIITPDEASAIKAYEDLSAITDGVLLYPKREFTFLDVEGISREFEHIRLGVLSKIIKNNYKIVVASVQAACQLTMPPDALTQCSFSICEGDELDIDETVERLIKAGYTRFDQVDGTSQFSIR